MMEVSAPFFNDPPAPPGEPGKPFNELWDYEVVEAFFLNDITEQYLEVELCPHGQHLVLLLSGRRNVWKQELALSFKVSKGETKWEGRAYLPWSYFPPNVTKFNSFAIHGSKDKRSYEALYPVPQHELQQGQKPDFCDSLVQSDQVGRMGDRNLDANDSGPHINMACSCGSFPPSTSWRSGPSFIRDWRLTPAIVWNTSSFSVLTHCLEKNGNNQNQTCGSQRNLMYRSIVEDHINHFYTF